MSQTHAYLSTNDYKQMLTDQDGAPVVGATVTMTLRQGRTSAGAVVPGVTWPVTLTDAGGGLYTYRPPFDLQVQPGKTYLAITNADLAGVRAHNEVEVRCVADTN